MRNLHRHGEPSFVPRSNSNNSSNVPPPTTREISSVTNWIHLLHVVVVIPRDTTTPLWHLTRQLKTIHTCTLPDRACTASPWPGRSRPSFESTTPRYYCTPVEAARRRELCWRTNPPSGPSQLASESGEPASRCYKVKAKRSTKTSFWGFYEMCLYVFALLLRLYLHFGWIRCCQLLWFRFQLAPWSVCDSVLIAYRF